MELERVKEKIISCDIFVENQAFQLISELKEEYATYGAIRQALETIPTNSSFGLVVKLAKELIEKEINAVTIK